MKTQKQRVLEGIDNDANENTREVAKHLTEEEANRLAQAIDKHLARIDGVTPITSILELKRKERIINYKLRLETQIWGGFDVSV